MAQQKISLRDVPALLRTYPGRRSLLARGISTLVPLIVVVARAWRRTAIRRTRIVAVVGSYGKTTTMRALATALCGDVHRYATNNSKLFVHHALLRVRPGQRHAVIEVGIGSQGQMAPMARSLRPDIVVVTAIGSEHGRSFGSLSATRAEKVKMVEALSAEGLAVLCGDDSNVVWMADRSKARVVTYGCDPGNDFRAVDVSVDASGRTSFRLDWAGGPSFDVRIRLLGTPGVHAALATLAVGLSEGISGESLIESLASFESTVGRLQLIPLASGALLLRDEFKSAVETIETALDVFATLPAQRKICVLGGVSEPPGPQGPVYRRVGARVAEVADEAIFMGGNYQRYASGAHRAGMSRSAMFDGERDILGVITRLRAELGRGDAVLLKGRDTERLDRIALALMGKDVRCAIPFCDARLTRCHHCKMLEKG